MCSSDLSLGATLHHALTATSIFGAIPDDGPLAALRHLLESAPVLATDLRDDEARLIAWCLRPGRCDRPATAALVADQLDRLTEAA